MKYKCTFCCCCSSRSDVLNSPCPKPTHPNSPCRHDSLPYPLFSFHSWLPMRQQHACGHRTPQSSMDHFQPSVNGKTRLILSPEQNVTTSLLQMTTATYCTVFGGVRPHKIHWEGGKSTIEHICRLKLSQAAAAAPFRPPLNAISYSQTIQQRGVTLTSTIILQLLQGPICVKTCRMRGSVTSLDRFPTYLQTRRDMGSWVFVKQEVACKQRLVNRASYNPQQFLIFT